ncbi:MAG: SpoIID/LytB domain-containing protein, partial [Clostridiales bacterium]|nr:SpoIID/LytB domain-containing protein [Clostridiales bacterium]
CDIQIEQGRALEVSLMPDNAGGHVMRASSTQIEIDEQVYLTDESFKVYSVADGAVKWKGLRDIIVGTDMALFFLNGTRAMAGVITKSVTPEKIRVVLQTTGYGGFVHQAVKIASSSSFTATQGQKTTNYSPGEVFDVSSMPKTGRIFLKADTAGAKFEIKSIARSWPSGESPKYSGAIEIGLEAGGYSIVNELSLEEYLYAVVPSEMPSSYGLEAAKVQAVTARSYAYNQFYQNRFHQYGANVDDSVNSQVYNNIPENETSIQAVDGTKGKVLSYNGAVVNANFFSTSAGVTANSGEVWAASQSEFPTYSTPYLSAKKQYTGKDYGDLSKEANAVAFFKAEGVHAFDSFSPWFRWTVEMSAEDLANSINANIRARYDAAPALVKTLLEGGVFRSRPINTIGNLIDLEILSRGEAGNAMELKIIGDKATVLVKTEYNIRALLSPYKQSTPINVVRSDGSTVTNSKLLPSAFIAIEKASKGGTVGNVTIYGGGYGHGVGMSQNGVKGMIDQGYSFSQILEHFYPGTKIKSM